MRTDDSTWGQAKRNEQAVAIMSDAEWNALAEAALAAHYVDTCHLGPDSSFVQKARELREIAGYGGLDD